MLTYGTLFTLGFLAVFAIGALGNRIGLFRAGGQYHVFVFWVIIVIATAGLLIASYEAMTFQQLRLIEWIMLGPSRAVLSGIAAGMVASGTIHAFASLHGQATPSVLGTMAVSPALIVALLYFIGDPELPRKFGLIGVEGVGVKLSFEPRGSPMQLQATSQSSPSGAANGSGGDENYWPLYDMTTQAGNKYFARQSNFLSDFHDLDFSGANSTPASQHAVDAIERQRRLVQSLNGVINCGGMHRQLFGNIDTLARLFGPIADAVVAIDLQLDALARLKPVPKPNEPPLSGLGSLWGAPVSGRADATWTKLADLQALLEARVNATRIAILELKPETPWQKESDKEEPAWKNCPAAEIRVARIEPGDGLSRFPDSFSVTPPYLAIFASHLYRAVELPDAALKVLGDWLKRHNPTPDGQYEGLGELILLRAQAELRFTLLQTDVSSSIYFDSTARDSLAAARETVERAWRVDLVQAGKTCDKVKSSAASDDASRRSKRKFALDSVYADLLGRYLHATVDARSPHQENMLTLDHVRWARALLDFAKTCLASDADDDETDQRALALVRAGRVLAHWAIDGPRRGMLLSDDVTAMRKDARQALVTALPLISRKDEADRKKAGSFRAGVGRWEPYRRLAEREILELDAALSIS